MHTCQRDAHTQLAHVRFLSNMVAAITRANCLIEEQERQ